MDQRAIYNRVAQLIGILLSAFTIKHLYSTSGVDELRWILAPTTFLVELISGVTFNFESHAGYLSSDRSFLIAASCAGVNFLIAAFLMLSLARFWRASLSWRFIPCAFILAYLGTIVANTVRISTALQLQQTPLEIASLSSNQIHRLEGILVYFGFLLVLFLVTERINHGSSTELPRSTPRFAEHHQNQSLGSLISNSNPALLPRFVFPLLVYYATTLGIPLGNALYTRNLDAAFMEHSAFVLLAPLLLILPLAAFRFRTKKAIHELHE
jgi:exosortase K